MKSPLKNKRARWGVFLLFLVGLYFLLILLVVPRYIKTPLNQQLSHLDLLADYEHLSINPLTLNVHIKQLQLQSAQHELLLTAAETTIDWQLLPLINKTFNLDRLILHNADVYLEFDQQNNLIKPTLPESSGNDKAATWRFEIGQISVENTNIHFQKGTQNHVIKQLNASHQAGSSSSQQPIDLSLRTDPEGQFSVVGGKQAKSGGWQLDWQLQNWPLAGLSDWILPAKYDSQVSAAISAQGTLVWLPDQLPNVTITQLDLDVEQAEFAAIAVNDLQINANEVSIDLNNSSLTVKAITSPKAGWHLKSDPYEALINVMQLLDNNDDDTTEQTWQFTLTELAIDNWHLETTDIELPSTYTIKQLKWQSATQTATTSQQQVLAAELLTPNSEPLQINAEAQLNPLILGGRIYTERLDLTAFNSLITPLSGWQLQQADIIIDSPFCYQNNQLVMAGLWSTDQLSAKNDSQFIAIKKFELAKLLLDTSQYHLYLNQLSAVSGEGGEVTAPTVPAATSPPSNLNESTNLSITDTAEQPIWQVFIGLPEQPACQP